MDIQISELIAQRGHLSAGSLAALVLLSLAQPAWAQKATTYEALNYAAENPKLFPLNPPKPQSSAPRFYAGVEYLLWSVKGAPLSVPLVSTGPASPPNDEGLLVNSQTTILYGAPFAPATGGNDKQNFSLFSGARLTGGFWVDDTRRLAIEASGFWLQSHSAGFSASGDSTGSPGMRIPLFNSQPYRPGGMCDPTGLCLVPTQEDGVPIAVPGALTGTVSIVNKLQFWGADLTGVIPIYRKPTWEVSALAGLQYLNLSESFTLSDSFGGLPNTMYAGQYGTVTDSFGTRNQFFGALAGLRGRTMRGAWSLEMTGRVALGVSHEVLTIQGYYQDFNAPYANSSGPYGTFAMPSNNGRTTSNRFAYVPEAQLKLGYDMTPSVRLTLGYDVIYYSNVIRPTDQIDRNVPKGQSFQQDPGVNSTTSPARLFNTTDFYAQGLNLGVSARF